MTNLFVFSCFLFFIIGSIIIYIFAEPLWKHLFKSKYLKAYARVQQNNFYEKSMNVTVIGVFEVQYSYIVQGNQYTSRIIHPGFDSKLIHSEYEKDEHFNRFAIDAEIEIFYNSDNPKDSFVDFLVPLSSIYFTIIGIVMLIMGVNAFLMRL